MKTLEASIAPNPIYALDYEADRLKTYEVIVTATDSQSDPGPSDLTASTLVVITVMNVDEAPTFNEGTDIARSIVEGTDARPVGLPVVATDPDGTSVTYAFEDGDNKVDEAFFTIGSTTGQLMTKAAGLDHEAKESRMRNGSRRWECKEG